MEKMYTFLRKKLKLIKKQNCLLNELNFITDGLKISLMVKKEAENARCYDPCSINALV